MVTCIKLLRLSRHLQLEQNLLQNIHCSQYAFCSCKGSSDISAVFWNALQQFHPIGNLLCYIINIKILLQ